MEYYKNFYYAGKCSSFSEAAEELCITQPAMSQSIRQLESKLNCDLFIRTPKGAKLTKEGEQLFLHVKKGIEEMEKGEREIQQFIKMQSGEIRIGASDMTLQFFLLPYLEKFHQLHPNIKVKVSNGPTPETLNYLYNGTIDFGVVSSPFEKREDVLVRDVKKIEDCFIVGKHMEHLSKQTLDLTELLHYPIICLEPNSSSRRYLDNFLKKNGITITPEFELATSDMIVQFALRNLGIGCVMKEFANKELALGNLFELKFKKQIPERRFHIVWSKQVPMAYAARELFEMIEKETELT